MAIVQYSTKNAAAAYRDLRETLKGQFVRDGWSGGGVPEPQICQVCGEDRAGQGWEGKPGDPGRMCSRCWAEGYYPGERREEIKHETES